MSGLRKQFFAPSSSKTRVTNISTDARIAASDRSSVLQHNISVGKKGSLVYEPVTNNTTTTNYVDPGAFDLVGKLITAQSGITSGALDFASAAQEKNALLAETKNTDGANLNQKTTLVALAVLAALAVVFLLIRGGHRT